MNLCVISSPALRTPPEDWGYGGIEREAYYLALGLTELGHSVILIARPDSIAPPGAILYGIEDEREVRDLAARISVESDWYPIHCFIDFGHDKLLSLARPDLPVINNYQVMSCTGSCSNPVCISHGQFKGKFEKFAPDAKVIYYGIKLADYPIYNGPRENYILYLGQMIPGKRVEWACQVALMTGIPLWAYGPWWGPPEYHEMLRQYAVDNPDLIHLCDSIGGKEKLERLQKARALIHPVGGMDTGGGEWCEAGAICVLEALATGTPCVVTDNGCLPEYITPGLNGYIGTTPEALAEGVMKVADTINPQECATSVLHFSHIRFAMEYAALARQVSEGLRWGNKSPTAG